MTKKRIALLILITMLLNVMQITLFASEPSNTTPVAAEVAAVKNYNDGGTHTLDENVTANGCDGAIYVTNKTKLTINGGNIHGLRCNGTKCGTEGCGFNMALWAKGEGVEVTINDGYFTNEGDGTDHSDLIYVKEGAMVYIKGGTFKCDTPKWTLNGKDNSPGQIIVTGGRFYQLDPSKTEVSGGTDEIVVPAGYKVVGPDAEGYYEVVMEESVAAVKNYNDGGTHTLNENVTANGCDGAIYVTNKTKLTINGGNIHGLRCNGTKCGTEGCGYNMALWAKGEGVEVTINDGYFTNEGDGTDHSDLIYVKQGAMVYIKGGTFKCDTPKWTLNGKDNSPGQIIVTGGRFYQLDPSKTEVSGGTDEIVVPAGYKVVGPDAEGYYEVVCAHKNGKAHEEVPATYTEVGTKAHWVCDLCEKMFTDSTAKTEITDLNIPKLATVTDNNATVTESAFDTAIKEAADSETVIIPVVETEKTVKTVTVPVDSLTDVVDVNKELSIETSEVTVTMNKKAIEKIIEQAENNENIQIEIIKVEDEVLNDKQKTALKDKDVCEVISAKILVNQKTISDFGGGKVKLEIPFTLDKNTKGTDYKVIYIADDGKTIDIPTKYVDGMIVVELEHFSEYAIVKVAKNNSGQGTPSNNNPAQGGAPAASAPAQTTTNNPATGDGIMVYFIVLAISIVGICGIFIIKAKRK